MIRTASRTFLLLLIIKNGESPDYITLNTFWENFNSSELQIICKDILYHMLKIKTFDNVGYRMVLEAKIVLGNDVIFSFNTEFIEVSRKDTV